MSQSILLTSRKVYTLQADWPNGKALDYDYIKVIKRLQVRSLRQSMIFLRFRCAEPDERWDD